MGSGSGPGEPGCPGDPRTPSVIVPAVDGVSEQETGEVPTASRVSVADLVVGADDLVLAAFRRLKAEGIQAERDELLAFGRQGLLEAAERYDPERGDFRRFAYFRVRGAMIDGLRKMGDWTRRGYERVHMLRAADAAAAGCAEEDGDPAALTAEQAAERLRQHMAAIVTAVTLGVFAESAYDDEAFTAKDNKLTAEELVGEAELQRLTREALEELPEPDKTVVRRFYLDGDKLDDIGAALGHTKSWASRVHTRALKRLGARLKAGEG